MLSHPSKPPGCPEQTAVVTEVVGLGVNVTPVMIVVAGTLKSLKWRNGRNIRITDRYEKYSTKYWDLEFPESVVN